MKVTPFTQRLAREGLAKTDGRPDDTCRQLLRDTFESISQSRETSPDERLLAKAGVAWGATSAPDQYAAAARRLMMQTLAGTLPGPVGCVLARATLEAVKEVPEDHGRAILLESLKAIEGLGGNEAVVARFGREAGASDMSDRDAVTARSLTVKALSEPVEGPPTLVVARLATAMADDMEPAAARGALLCALSLIQTSGTPEQQRLATLGRTMGASNISDSAAVALRKAVARTLQEPSDDPAPLLLARAALEAVDSPEVDEAAGRNALRDALEAISKEPEATPHQRALAQLGVKAAANDISDQDAFTIRRICLAHLEARPVGSPARAVAETCVEAAGTIDHKSARALLRTGFETIRQLGNSEQQEMARLGIEWGASNISDQEAKEIRLGQMQAVLDTEVDVEAQVEQLSEALTTAPGGIERDEVQVDINGFLVSVNQDVG